MRLLLFILLSAVGIFPRQNDYTFYHLSLEDGLSQSTVNTIYQDPQGYLWFGTANGLNKYDGYTFTVYKQNPLDSSSLSSDMITSVYMDSRGILWVGTEEGLNRMVHPGKFIRYRFSHEDNSTISNDHITSICEDKSGALYITTLGGLNKFDYLKGTFNRLYNSKGEKNSSYWNMIRSAKPDDENIIWIASAGGVSKFYPERKRFENLSGRDMPARVNSLCFYGSDFLFAGTGGNGLYLINRKNGTSEKIRLDSNKNGPYITELLMDRENILWCATMGTGLIRYDVTSRISESIMRNPLNPEGLTDNSIYSLLEDRGGVLWIGTAMSGINKYIKGRTKFLLFRQDPFSNTGISNSVIYSMHLTKKDEVLIGTVQGINIYDNDKQTVSPLILPKYRYKDEIIDINNLFISSLESTEHGLWVGTRGGLYFYNRLNNSIKGFWHRPTDTSTISTNFITSLVIDEQGSLWIAGAPGVIDELKTDGSVKHYYIPKDKHLPVPRTYTLKMSASGTLLIGTSGGLFSLERGSGTFSLIARSGDRYPLIGMILTIFPDSQNNIWLGTYGGGLYKISSGGTITHINSLASFPSNVVYGILPDNSGSLWLSTNKGICKFTPGTNRLRVFDLKDGLQSYEYNSNAYLRTSKGMLFFGGVNGLNAFTPEEVRDNPNIPPVMITSVKVMGSEIENITPGTSVSLSYNDNFISFEFVSLDYTYPSSNKYAYRLEGVDKDWVMSGSRRFASYTNLEPGEYRFTVRGSNSDDVWNQKGASLSFVIHPPFWNTWLFYLISVIAAAGSVVLIHKYRLRSKIRQLMEIEKIRKGIADDFHDELGHKLTKISLYSQLMKNELDGKLNGSQDYLTKIYDAANHLYDDTKDFIWSIDPVKDSLYDLAVYLKDFGDELFDKTGISFIVKEIPSDLSYITMSMGSKRQLILIFKEAMNNILKHSGSSFVSLSVGYVYDTVEIILSDDGVGIGELHESKGRGMSSMTARAEKIGGQLKVMPNSKAGTSVIFRLEHVGLGNKNRKLNL